MTPRALYLALYRAGVSYWETPRGTLGYRAPHGLSAELKAAMKAQKDDLLFLCSGDVTIYGQGQRPISNKMLDLSTGRWLIKYLDEDEYVDAGPVGSFSTGQDAA